VYLTCVRTDIVGLQYSCNTTCVHKDILRSQLCCDHSGQHSCTMRWLRLVGSIKLQVSFAEYSLFYRALLRKRPVILSILLTVATPYGSPTKLYYGPKLWRSVVTIVWL